MSRHLLNKFRQETEYHDMVLSFQNVCNPEICFFEEFSDQLIKNFAGNQPDNIKIVLEKLTEIHETQKEAFQNYLKETQKIPTELEVFLTQIQELKALMKNTQDAQEKVRKANLKEKKLKNSLRDQKEKNHSPEQIAKAESEYNKFKEELNTLQQNANSQRKLYIEKSDRYTVDFPCELSNVILKLIDQRQHYLQSCVSIANQIVEVSKEFSQPEELKIPNIDEIDFSVDGDFEDFLRV